MFVFYSGSARGFFDRSTHGNDIPVDAVEITVEERSALLDGERAGQVIVPDSNGFPVLEAPPAPTVDQIVAGYESALQSALDAGARSWGYDDIRSAISYVGDPYPRFDAEAKALRAWRSDVWVWAGNELSKIKANAKPVPASVAAFVAAMPAPPARPV